MSSSLDRFLAEPDVKERFERAIAAPAGLVMRTACEFDLQALPPIRAIIRLRKWVLGGSSDEGPRRPIGLVAETRGLGWGTLVEDPGRLLICGAVCRPWQGDVVFTAIPAGTFAGHHEPDQVKIVWSLEAVETERNRTHFVHEVRAQASDGQARRKFMRYWRWARFGIVAIRMLLLPAIQRKAEHDGSAGARQA